MESVHDDLVEGVLADQLDREAVAHQVGFQPVSGEVRERQGVGVAVIDGAVDGRRRNDIDLDDRTAGGAEDQIAGLLAL